MNTSENILKELSEISKEVAAIPKVNVFTVPSDYFKSLSTNILYRIQNDKIFAAGNMKLNVGDVPEGYFEGLAGQIMNKIKAGEENSVQKETKVISGTVAKIGNRNIFSVPEGYFQSLSEVINLRISKPAKVVSMKKSSFFNYAAAAVITGILGLSVFSVLNQNEIPDNNIGQSEEVMAKAGEIIKNKTFDIELQNISDKEIEQYLIQDGQDVNAALVASVIDENNLPGTDEYLTDDNTLDEFLKRLNLNN